ncbi:MAG: 23S rRNA (adenine(2030)-N(6))-methyltransferase RlmJ [Candidimonas sp.]|nr:MAG: 23S rRNA (adenine(2030)-N(6))-methyltransferase RlmJ [Candidimonas sp.]
MFSYRHAFHAGNHADVLKHAIFLYILNYFNRKEAPYTVVDTHAGAGIYDLTGDWASQNAEYVNGFDRLLDAPDTPPLIEDYLQAVRGVNADGVARYYPGSPWLALHALREHDRLRLFEKHPTEVDVLRHNLAGLAREYRRRTQIHDTDGFDGLRAVLPPPTRRGVTLIDPSYEDKADYRRVRDAVNEGLARFSTGCFMIWYPLVPRIEPPQLARSLERCAAPHWVHASLTVCRPAPDGRGLHGSAVFVINPPWPLHAELKRALPWLRQRLARDDRAGFALDQKTT